MCRILILKLQLNVYSYPNSDHSLNFQLWTKWIHSLWGESFSETIIFNCEKTAPKNCFSWIIEIPERFTKNGLNMEYLVVIMANGYYHYWTMDIEQCWLKSKHKIASIWWTSRKTMKIIITFAIYIVMWCMFLVMCWQQHFMFRRFTSNSACILITVSVLVQFTIMNDTPDMPSALINWYSFCKMDTYEVIGWTSKLYLSSGDKIHLFSYKHITLSTLTRRRKGSSK